MTRLLAVLILVSLCVVIPAMLLAHAVSTIQGVTG